MAHTTFSSERENQSNFPRAAKLFVGMDKKNCNNLVGLIPARLYNKGEYVCIIQDGKPEQYIVTQCKVKEQHPSQDFRLTDFGRPIKGTKAVKLKTRIEIRVYCGRLQNGIDFGTEPTKPKPKVHGEGPQPYKPKRKK